MWYKLHSSPPQCFLKIEQSVFRLCGPGQSIASGEAQLSRARCSFRRGRFPRGAGSFGAYRRQVPLPVAVPPCLGHPALSRDCQGRAPSFPDGSSEAAVSLASKLPCFLLLSGAGFAQVSHLWTWGFPGPVSTMVAFASANFSLEESSGARLVEARVPWGEFLKQRRVRQKCRCEAWQHRAHTQSPVFLQRLSLESSKRLVHACHGLGTLLEVWGSRGEGHNTSRHPEVAVW